VLRKYCVRRNSELSYSFLLQGHHCPVHRLALLPLAEGHRLGQPRITVRKSLRKAEILRHAKLTLYLYTNPAGTSLLEAPDPSESHTQSTFLHGCLRPVSLLTWPRSSSVRKARQSRHGTRSGRWNMTCQPIQRSQKRSRYLLCTPTLPHMLHRALIQPGGVGHHRGALYSTLGSTADVGA
jgi:hypothetical protein